VAGTSPHSKNDSPHSNVAAVGSPQEGTSLTKPKSTPPSILKKPSLTSKKEITNPSSAFTTPKFNQTKEKTDKLVKSSYKNESSIVSKSVIPSSNVNRYRLSAGSLQKHEPYSQQAKIDADGYRGYSSPNGNNAAVYNQTSSSNAKWYSAGPPSDVPSVEQTRCEQNLDNFPNVNKISQDQMHSNNGAMDDLDKLSKLIEDRQKSLRKIRRDRR